jgi:hypothetical protein
MTDEARALFLAVEAVLQAQGAAFDDLCDTYASAFREDADRETHETVKSSLHTAADHLQQAGMDWYVSTK